MDSPRITRGFAPVSAEPRAGCTKGCVCVCVRPCPCGCKPPVIPAGNLPARGRGGSRRCPRLPEQDGCAVLPSCPLSQAGAWSSPPRSLQVPLCWGDPIHPEPWPQSRGVTALLEEQPGRGRAEPSPPCMVDFLALKDTPPPPQLYSILLAMAAAGLRCYLRGRRGPCRAGPGQGTSCLQVSTGTVPPPFLLFLLLGFFLQ